MDKKGIKKRCIPILLKVDFLSNAPLESCKLCTAVLRTDRGIRKYGSSKFPLGGGSKSVSGSRPIFIYSKNTRIHKYETKGWEKHERYLFMFITYMCVNIWIDSFVLILMFLVIIITFVSIRIKNTLCWCGHCDGCWRICCRRRGVCCCRQRSAVWITEIVFTAVWWTSSHHTL